MDRDDRPIGDPTDEEVALMALMAGGLTDEDAAKRLGWTRRMVLRRLRSAMDKLEARSRFEAGFRLARAGWLDER